MPRPTISIVTPAHPARVRNGKLARALGSVYTQTLLPDAIHVAIDNEKAGAAATRQRALDSVRTEWTACLDSDDWLAPKHLQWLMQHALDTEADYVYSWFKVALEGPDGNLQILEDDPIFPPGHYLNEFDPNDPIETTITTLVRTELAQAVGFQPLDRGHDANSGEDAFFTLGCVKAGAKIRHLRRKSWFWSHSRLADGSQGNTSGIAGRGDDR